MPVGAPDTEKVQRADERAGRSELSDAANLLVQIGGIRIGGDEEFTFASGLRSPIYCDNRLFLSHPPEREAVVEHLVCLIRRMAGTDWDAIAGVASAGIPFAAWVAHELHAPMAYVRPVEKEHGTRRRIEGGLPWGNRVILVEDLVTTGESALSAVGALREAGLQCHHCASIVDYRFETTSRRFESQHLTQETLTDTEGLLRALSTQGAATESDIERVRAWHRRVNAAAGTVCAGDAG